MDHESPLKRYSQQKNNTLSTSILNKKTIKTTSNIINSNYSNTKIIKSNQSNSLTLHQTPSTPISITSPTTFKPSTPNKTPPLATQSLHPKTTPSHHPSLTPHSSKIPLTLNPIAISTGVKLGRKRLLDRIRVNLISLVIIWILTSTRFYNQVITSIGSRIPILSVPLQVIEWFILMVIIGNLLEGYYKLKTQVPITHVEMPLTPQQIRGSVRGSKNSTTGGILSPSSVTPFRRSQNLSASVNASQMGNKFNLSENSPTTTKNILNSHNHEILTKDPMMNPLKSSTNHLFKRSIFNSNNGNDSSNHSESHYLRHSFPSRLNPSINVNTSLPNFNLSPVLQNHLSQSFVNNSTRKVSNRDSLHKLLEETLAS